MTVHTVRIWHSCPGVNSYEQFLRPISRRKTNPFARITREEVTCLTWKKW